MITKHMTESIVGCQEISFAQAIRSKHSKFGSNRSLGEGQKAGTFFVKISHEGSLSQTANIVVL